MLTRKKVKVFMLAKPDQKAEYETLLNDPKISHISRDEFTFDKRTGHPIIVVWYEEYIK